MKIRALTLLVPLLACACAGPRPARPDPSPDGTGEVQILVDTSAEESLEPPARAAWLGYAAKKAFEMTERASPTGDDFAIELPARTALVEIWRKLRAEEAAADPYLDALTRVYEAGFLDEYVLLYHARPGWTLPGEVLAGLDPAGFERFGRENLSGHEERTYARAVRAGSAQPPRVPGNELPDADALAPGGALCAEHSRATRALARWTEEERQLDAIALGVSDSVELLRALRLVRDERRYRERGIVWVSDKAAALSFIVGFCEMERRDPAASLAPLEGAVSLAPIYPMWRLELAQALALVGRLTEAEHQVDVALAIIDPQDACTLGAAWRRRGYILIERGELQQAYRAYQRSLDYEPTSEVAASELQLIESELQQQKGQVPDYTPPPGGLAGIVRCTPR